MTPWTKRWFQYSLLFILAFVWGSSFILMKIGLLSFSSAQVASLRIFLASLVLLPLSIKNLKLLKRKDILPLLVAGFVGTYIPALLFTKAQVRIDSALAGMLNSLTPVFTLIIGLIILKGRTSWLQVSGLIIGFFGAAGLILQSNNGISGNFNGYAFYIIAATMCYGFSINIVKKYLTHLKGVQITGLAFLFIGPVALTNLLAGDIQSALLSPNWEMHLLAVAVLGIIGTVLAMLIMYSLIRYTSAVFASSVTYIIPVFALVWGILDGETISLFHVVSLLLILLGVYLINRKN